MKITIEKLELSRRDQLRQRLEQVAALRCAQHDAPVSSVVIHGRENGWFDSQWTTCCEALEREAASIMKERC